MGYHHTKIDLSRPGKPTYNCYVETFNETFLDEDAENQLSAWSGKSKRITVHIVYFLMCPEKPG